MKKIILSIIILGLFQNAKSQLYDKIEYAGNKKLSVALVYDIETAFEDFMQMDILHFGKKYCPFDRWGL